MYTVIIHRLILPVELGSLTTTNAQLRTMSQFEILSENAKMRKVLVKVS
jgi:hypothetical protein